ncbi:hypothetical protein [Paenibacillus aceris]|uniref:Uncharacterized protein n=1 Tax=Paenibacillus aceris TaxID=869555 RepID=A0ABS4I961_9BACL|nr:hypothetical protein [Paenibacillus aceris]MBP1967016.1 hypothetical protein [Paenibacillus aceris]NHW33213.1 hypothetical protein [Paenibacillus aceris]
MATEQNKPVYYDGSGIIQVPPQETSSKDIVIKPADVSSKPIQIPYFPYLR